MKRGIILVVEPRREKLALGRVEGAGRVMSRRSLVTSAPLAFALSYLDLSLSAQIP